MFKICLIPELMLACDFFLITKHNVEVLNSIMLRCDTRYIVVTVQHP
jgi:hypothetical protein